MAQHAVCFDLLRMSNNGAVYPPDMDNESKRRRAMGIGMRRMSASSDGESNDKLSGCRVAEMGMAIALTRVRLSRLARKCVLPAKRLKEVP
jgi:hypothetical protein